MPQGTNQKLSYLIHRCWHPQPALRPSFTEIDNAYLQPIIVETAIPDEVGRVLWKNHFLNLDAVNWEQFVMAFYAILNLTLDVPSDAPLLDVPLGVAPADQMLRQATLSRLEEYARISAEAYARCVDEVKRRQGHSFYNLLKKLLGMGPSIVLLVHSRVTVEKVHEKEVVTMERFGLFLGLFGPLYTQSPMGIFERMANILPRPWFYGDLDKDAAFELLRNKQPGTFLVRFSSNPEHVGFVISVVDHKNVRYRTPQLRSRALPF